MQIRSVGLFLFGWLWSGLVAGAPVSAATLESQGGVTRPLAAQQAGLLWDPVRPQVTPATPTAASHEAVWIGEGPAATPFAPIVVAPQRASGFERLRRSLPYGVTHSLVIKYLGDDQ